jgi:hypothetical protein
LIARSFDQISETDIRSLVENAVSERISLECKRELAFGDSDKKEFLADVSSFANTVGGDLIVGVEQSSNGVAIAVPGIEIANPDRFTQQIDSLVRDGISPRLPSVASRLVTLQTGKSVLVLRVRQSWLSPHRVEFGGHRKFYARGTNGKFPMDVQQLRSAFTATETAIERALALRERRLEMLRAGQVPGFVRGKPTLVVHMVPAASTSGASGIDLARVASIELDKLRPVSGQAWFPAFSIDGLRVYSARLDENAPLAQVQYSRDGVVELVDQGAIIRALNFGRTRTISARSLEETVISWVDRIKPVFAAAEVLPPVVVCVSLLDVRDISLTVEPNEAMSEVGFELHALDRQDILLPHGFLESWDAEVAVSMRATFDGLWNAIGMPRCPHFDQNGHWIRT